jgi:hypothetical protein
MARDTPSVSETVACSELSASFRQSVLVRLRHDYSRVTGSRERLLCRTQLPKRPIAATAGTYGREVRAQSLSRSERHDRKQGCRSSIPSMGEFGAKPASDGAPLQAPDKPSTVQPVRKHDHLSQRAEATLPDQALPGWNHGRPLGEDFCTAVQGSDFRDSPDRPLWADGPRFPDVRPKRSPDKSGILLGTIAYWLGCKLTLSASLDFPRNVGRISCSRSRLGRESERVVSQQTIAKAAATQYTGEKTCLATKAFSKCGHHAC